MAETPEPTIYPLNGFKNRSIFCITFRWSLFVECRSICARMRVRVY